MKKSGLLILFLLLTIAVFAQDKIYLKNNDVILCRLVEVGEDYIKYTLEETGDLIYEINVVRVEKIVFESGKEISFSNPAPAAHDIEMYFSKKKNIVKFGFLSPLTGALSIGYERSLKPGKSIETNLAIIGVGFQYDEKNPRGAYLDVGYKFIVLPNTINRGTSYRNLLQGFYIKPKLGFATYDITLQGYNPTTGAPTSFRENVTALNVMLDLGWQWVISDVFVINLWGGMGYGFNNLSASKFNGYFDYFGPQYHYGFAIMGQNFPLSLAGGFKIGYSF